MTTYFAEVKYNYVENEDIMHGVFTFDYNAKPEIKTVISEIEVMVDRFFDEQFVEVESIKVVESPAG